MSEPATESAADAACERLGDLPLAVALACTFLEGYDSVSVPGYLGQLAAAEEGLLAHPSLVAELDGQLPTAHSESIAATFGLRYTKLDKEDDDGLALKMFHLAAQYAPAPIPWRLLVRAAGLDPDDAAEAMAGDAALRRLAQVGLVEPLPDGNQRLHRLLAAYGRDRAADEAADRAAVEDALVSELYRINEAGYPAEGVMYIARAHVAADRDALREDRRLGTMLNNLAYLLKAQGDYGAARPLFERALAIREKALGPDDPVAATVRGNLRALDKRGRAP